MNNSDGSSGKTLKSQCSKLLMNTLKIDISSVDASFELPSIPLFRSSHLFQSVSLTGCRVLQQSGINTITNSTIIDKYLSRHKNYHSSLYQFISNNGRVPVINGPTQASWPLQEKYCKTTLLLHFPNWRCLSDVKNDATSWTEFFLSFLESDNCPNFVKADIERAKEKEKEPDNLSQEHEVLNSDVPQPEWMEALRPNPNYDNSSLNFTFDDGNPDHDWSDTSHIHPDDLGKDWWTASQVMKIKMKV